MERSMVTVAVESLGPVGVGGAIGQSRWWPGPVSLTRSPRDDWIRSLQEFDGRDFLLYTAGRDTIASILGV